MRAPDNGIHQVFAVEAKHHLQTTLHLYRIVTLLCDTTAILHCTIWKSQEHNRVSHKKSQTVHNRRFSCCMTSTYLDALAAGQTNELALVGQKELDDVL